MKPLILTWIALVLAAPYLPAAEPTPEEIVDGFEKRVDRVFRAEAGQPLKRAKKQPPLRPGRGNYVRAYSYSMVRFAARCFYLGEKLDEANAVLVENARHYLDHPLDINDRDSFHWHADIVMRLIEMYGANGTARAGLLTAETEKTCLEPIWIYASQTSSLEKAEFRKSQTWNIYSTENHHAMDFTVCWHYAKLAKDRPGFRDRKFGDGATAAEHYRAWSDYIVAYCRERARKGPCVEIMCAGYNAVWLKGFHNFHDFGDERVSRAAGMLLDLYWAYWAQEQLGGIEGGGKARIRGVNGFSRKAHGIPSLGWLYFGIGEPPRSLDGELNAALSRYRPPEVVADIVANSRSHGPYEVRQRAQGLGIQSPEQSAIVSEKLPNRLHTDGGGIVRYSYCDPAFTLGTLMTEARPVADWVSISIQSRWQGVIFAGEPASRIVPTVLPSRGRDVMNGWWSVQSKGSLITQKLKQNKNGGPLIVWMSRAGLSAPVKEDGVVFVEAAGAYAAIRVANGGFRIANEPPSVKADYNEIREAPPGWLVIPEREFTPVILEVMAKDRVDGFESFKRKVMACKLEIHGEVLHYDTIYGYRLTFDTAWKNVPAINGEAVNYAPPKVLESPFLNSDYNSGVVEIRSGTRKEVLDFNKQN